MYVIQQQLLMKWCIDVNIDNINFICACVSEFCGVTNWNGDISNKSKNINLYKSDDDKIRYCVLNESNNNQTNYYDTIFINEWINTFHRECHPL